MALAASREFPEDDLTVTAEISAVRPLPVTEAPFEARLVFEAELSGGGRMRFADYASAGKGYDKEIAVWLPGINSSK